MKLLYLLNTTVQYILLLHSVIHIFAFIVRWHSQHILSAMSKCSHDEDGYTRIGRWLSHPAPGEEVVISG